MIRQFMSQQFLLFLVTGRIAAVVNFSSRIVYSFWLDFSTAIIVAYITGMITAFILAKLFVFRGGQQPFYKSAASFMLVNLIAVMQTWVVSMVLAYYVLTTFFGVTRFVEEISHAIGIMVPVFTSYLGHKYWSFK